MKLKNTLLYLVTGLLLGLAYPPVDFYFLIFAGYAMLIHLIDTSSGYKELLKRVYFSIIFFELFATSWIGLSGMRESADRFLIAGGVFVIFFHPLFFLFPSLIYYSVVRNLKSEKYPNIHLLAFPFIFTAFEYLQTLTEVTFPWLFAGNAFSNNLEKIQFIDFTGVYGVSFWALALSALVYYVFRTIKNTEGNIFDALKKREIKIALVLTVVIYILPNIYTGITSPTKRYLNNSDEKISVGVIQPNVGAWVKWGSNKDVIVGEYSAMVRKLSADKNNLKLIVLPETAMPFYFLYDLYDSLYIRFKNACDSSGAAVLTGTPDMRVYENKSLAKIDSKVFSSRGQYYDTYNTALLLEKGKGKNELQRYNKMKLVTGSERMPYQRNIPFLKNIIKWGVGLSSYQLGEDTTLFNLDGKYIFNTAICFESVFPGFFSDFINKGAQFSVIITNDAWWGKFFGTYQHNQYAIFRSIENRRWIVRSANTGVSCIIDPCGNMYDKTKINEKASFTSVISIRNEKTFYTKYGDVFSVSIAVISGMFFLYGFIRKRVKKN
jgi:apolipoprotein N-acyltransferase